MYLQIPGYNHFEKSAMKASEARKGRRFGGLLTYIKSTLSSKVIPHTNTRILPVSVGNLCVANVYLPYNGHPDETLYFSCLNELEALRTQSAAFTLVGDTNPTGDNLLPFQSFCTQNGLHYDKTVKWTFMEPRVHNTSRLDFCLVEQGSKVRILSSATVLDSVIKGGHVPLVTSVNVKSYLLEQMAVTETPPRQYYRPVPKELSEEFKFAVNARCEGALATYQRDGCVEQLLKNVDRSVQKTLDRFYPKKSQTKRSAGQCYDFPSRRKSCA